MEFRAAAERVLFAETLEEKLEPGPAVAADDSPGPAIAKPHAPGRPPELRIREKGVRVDFPGIHRLDDDRERGVMLHFLANPAVDGALRTAEKLAKASLPALVAWQQRWLYDVFSVKLSGKIRYYPRYQRELAALAGRVSTGSLNRAIKAANERRAVADHPLSAKLFVEDMLLEYTSCCA